MINVPGANLAFAVDYCGVKSGREVDKFAALGLSRVPAHRVRAPLIDECPLAIECRVRNLIPLGSHHMFIAEVLAVDVEAALIDRSGRLQLEKAALLVLQSRPVLPGFQPFGEIRIFRSKKEDVNAQSTSGLPRRSGGRRADSRPRRATPPGRRKCTSGW